VPLATRTALWGYVRGRFGLLALCSTAMQRPTRGLLHVRAVD